MSNDAKSMYEEFKLEHLGPNSDDGVRAVDEITAAVVEVSKMVLDDRHRKKGSVTLTIDITAQGDAAVSIDSKVSVKKPARKHKGFVAFPSPRENSLSVQKGTQLSLDGVMREARGTAKDPTDGR